MYRRSQRENPQREFRNKGLHFPPTKTYTAYTTHIVPNVLYLETWTGGARQVDEWASIKNGKKKNEKKKRKERKAANGDRVGCWKRQKRRVP